MRRPRCEFEGWSVFRSCGLRNKKLHLGEKVQTFDSLFGMNRTPAQQRSVKLRSASFGKVVSSGGKVLRAPADLLTLLLTVAVPTAVDS